MKKTIRMQSALAAIILLSGAVGFALDSSEAAYKSRRLSFQSAEGMPNPEVTKGTNGKGKMPSKERVPMTGSRHRSMTSEPSLSKNAGY